MGRIDLEDTLLPSGKAVRSIMCCVRKSDEE